MNTERSYTNEQRGFAGIVAHYGASVRVMVACGLLASSGCATELPGVARGGTNASTVQCVEPCVVQEILDVTAQVGAEDAAALAAGAMPDGCITEDELAVLLEEASLSAGDNPLLQFTGE